MGILHTYRAQLHWTGAGETGTTSYTSYSRDHELVFAGKPPLPGSSDPSFRGDPHRYSPEELLLGALSQCHMLWFLHLAAQAGVVVVDYSDDAVGTMRVESAGAGQFTRAVLRPRVTVRDDNRRDDGVRDDGRTPVDDAQVMAVHRRAGEHCFIQRSVNFPVLTEPAPIRHVAGHPARG